MYLIPKNVKSRFEFFTGFGFRELAITSLGLAIGGILFFIVGFVTASFARIFLIALGGGIGFFLSIPDPREGKSLLHRIQDFREFNSRPKKYFYVFGSGRRNIS